MTDRPRKKLNLEELEGAAARAATDAHKGQTRWDKSIPYITHPCAVANEFKDVEGEEGVFLRTVAWLHDVVEDTDLTLDNLEELGFSRDVTEAVCLVTKIKDDDYIDYILRISRNRVACLVKLADIRHNLSSLKKRGSMRDKYQLAVHILENSECLRV